MTVRHVSGASRVPRRTVLIADYAREGECFHIVRRRLGATPGPLHDHDCHELFWIETGRAAHRVNGADQTLGPGDAVFVRPGDRHRLAAIGPAPCRIANLMFRSESAGHLGERYAERLAGRLFWSEAPAPDTVSLDAAALARAAELCDRLDAGPRELVHVEGFLLELLTGLIDAAPALPPAVPGWLARACRAVRDPELFRRGATGLVAASGKSHEHVCRAVRRHLGTSPSAYVNAVRMEHAARLLAGTDESVVAVSLACGIGNASHFHRLFRERFGTTPKAYRCARRGATG